MQRNNDTIKLYRKKINKAIHSISNMNNIVPTNLKKTFNFKGRKSIDIAEHILSAISLPNYTIGDPFVGSNTFGIAARKNNLKFKGCELDNYTFSTLTTLFNKYNSSNFERLYHQIEIKCKDKINELYSTTCCDRKNYISKLHYDPEGNTDPNISEYYSPTPHRDIKNNENIILAKPCPVCKRKRKKFTKVDEEKIIYTQKLDTSRFPNHYLIENSRINITSAHNADKYDRNFTNRAKYALLLIQDEINNLPNCFERDILEHCLVSSLTLSRICQYGSGSEYIYQVMRKQAQEKNVWEIFNDKVDAFTQFKKDYALQQFDNIASDKCDMQIVNSDYKLFLDNNLSTFDIIYTDPPYTDQVPYLERSQLYRDWLHKFYDKNNDFILSKEQLHDEIVITNAPTRLDKAGNLQYFNDIDIMFNKFYTSLKSNGLVVMTVKLGSKKYIQTLAKFIHISRKNGFEFITKYCIDKKDPTLRKQAARINTMANELLLFFIKLPVEDTYWYINDTNFEFELIKKLYHEIKHSSNGFLTISDCINQINKFMLNNYDILPTDDYNNRIRKIVHDNFYTTTTSFVYIDPNKLYLDVEDSSDLFSKLYDILPIIIKNFDKSEGFYLEDLYYEIIHTLFNGNNNALNQIINDKHHESEIKTLLGNYCTISNDHKYILKKYELQNIDGCIDVSSMDGYEFEKLITNLLIKKGYQDVVRIGGAGDRGVDIIAKKIIDGKLHGYIFQCKRWIGNVGGIPIQRLHSMMIQMSPTINHAVCITTSNYTADAQRESQNTNVKLIDGQTLMDELNILFPNQYYHAALNLIK